MNTKALAIGAVVIVLLVAGSVWLVGNQNKKVTSTEKSAMTKEEEHMMGKGYVMKDGKMQVEENGEFTVMTQDVMLKNGTKVMTNGTVVKPDGTTMTLTEGQSIWEDGSIMDEKEMMKGYSGKVIAGSNTPYVEFTKADYDKALAEGKVVVLNFYANWCPVCRAEVADIAAGFDSLNNPNVVGFRVNYKDSDTDKDEEALAKQFSIPYQHTKVILKDGKEVLKETVQWSKGDLVKAVNAAL